MRRHEMAGRSLRIAVAAACAGLVLPWLVAASPAGASQAGDSPAGGGGGCSAGAHTLASPGSLLYPETGNGGYTSLHTLVHLVYNATTNKFLPGNRVALTERATQCLTSFSLDFERTSANTSAGPDMTVSSVSVNGVPARFSFVQPTYPGDPNGQNDPNPAAHEASESNPVGGPNHNPLPPACTPELPNTDAAADSMNGTQCPANKLVITPPTRIRGGAPFTVTVNYTGRPGVHNDGDGTTEGWFRASDGGFVTTEPVASEDWMPLNDYPTAKPSYDFSDTVTAGRTVVANGELVSVRHHPASPEFPGGSVTWNWHAGMPVASYLVEDSVGNYSLTSRVVNGIRFYQAQDLSISAAQRTKNLAIMDMQPDITAFESQFNGPFPFASNGIIIGTPDASFDEEMEGMIAFAGGQIDTDTLYHENMHQWWGDNVSEGGYRMTFYKEGLATLAEFFYAARLAENAAGGPSTAKGRAAFQASLVKQFNQIYGSGTDFWTTAPSNPIPYSLFDTSNTYNRPGAAYIALRQILGPARFDAALRQLQRTYGGSSITEPELEAVFHRWLPVHSSACQQRLSQFFKQWFDTAYPAGGGANRPTITGPGLAGSGFYAAGGTCA
ncbi:MAG: M1 family aminopeptidase [Trebonia sp.]